MEQPVPPLSEKKTEMIRIKNATIINEGRRFKANVLIDGERIKTIAPPSPGEEEADEEIDAEGLLLLPGCIDDQVHFREPGLTYKGDIHSESRAAVAGGITSFMDMPNTIPQTTTVEALNDKFNRAAKESMANYAFFIGATNDNGEELKKKGAERAAAIKVFMGSSTGNMLVDNEQTLEHIFAGTGKIVAVHCESETVIAANKARFIRKAGENPDITFHAKIRDAEACFRSSSEAVRLAKKYGTRLHIFHLSTERELSLLEAKPLKEKRITAEACIHHLWFCEDDCQEKGNLIKWNPAIKSRQDRDALRKALIEGKIDVVATDHAPHTLQEKEGSCLRAASGGPMVQHALTVMLELCRQGVFTEELTVEKMAHAPAELFGIKDRGYIREGYYADLVLVNPHHAWTVGKENLLYKCGWSPLEGSTFANQVEKTFVNGRLVYDNGRFDENFRGKELVLL
ncbi:MAG: dihydroorotase [Candidatus Symbiothrix sp.]|jgi:dihydroorotase|nr:dihydroorotase [Candidatus Symbiothrix sp.]